ncbi:MAG: dehypoxanthine futalosine cyclase [Negativicutes bacterium]|nr:dehypoxanthine futalosine cyclase [Negativicutes bacterium]MBP8630003.1 dehypoxanthine futalosine cyclase [Negativicutes bacterium]MBP9537863.1 dehypoxanthine futalosine cyclase [Negativicutes bacterium]MBP9949958.1 dehypoxanthine futalosine cyclase [Negativicutes bacterium]
MSISAQEALNLLKHEDILVLGKMADKIRQQKHPDNVVSFVVDRNINYTNICTSECKFCAFYRKEENSDTYVLSNEVIMEKIKETIEAGGTQIMLQGGLNPNLRLGYYVDLLKMIKSKYNITIHSFSPAEIVHIAKQENMSVKAVLLSLHEAGLDSLPGGGAEILVDEIRYKISPKKITADQWLNVMEEAHKIGMKSTATMVIGFGETLEQRIEHMQKIKELQEKTGGFRAFITWTFQPGNTELGGKKTNAWEYLRTLAVTRIYLDNIEHIQGSWVTQGQETGQITLAFGANDLGSIMLEENVVRAAGTAYEMSINKMVNLITASGKIPAQRDTEYNIIKKF